MLILLGNHDLINVWLWFQGTECRFLNKYFMTTIYFQEKAELSPPSMTQAVWYSPIMDSDLNEHVFKRINSAMVITQAGRSPLGGNSLGVPQKRVNINHVPGKQNFTQQTWEPVFHRVWSGFPALEQSHPRSPPIHPNWSALAHLDTLKREAQNSHLK